MRDYYEKIFDIKRQEKMRSFFLDLAKQGSKKFYKKGEIIKINSSEAYIAIVTKGRVKQSVFGYNGREKILYFLQPGEIFGEFAYLGGGEDMIEGQAMEHSEISVLFEKDLERILKSNPEAYKYITHSMCRKFRILMMQLYDLLFKDSLGKLCDVLLRLCCQQNKVLDDGRIIDLPLTHENIAQLIGCDRVTVTKCLNKLKKEGIIEVSQKKIMIKQIEKLEEFVG
ncbi:MAG: family transcriptional regulator, cyclic receptor protein [Tepidanaerobacteraceae bacterium]|jgi:CRP-like cAMP-binding protein|uniref:cAMP-binding domain of CRP or a regulatory subunit of cAMP-dependent protein kinases n=1 Tax=Caldanaerovirga acetigignens TaxID=447595 RepID=A0A1M7LY59_9FIRM|nr:Crp/Fnr family transcriptional regulator [Caldanaerovirga acetigignens]MDN5331526.1 family transcriptional regulator, cyclic receptor protein [Tepidanaerobacteraceae bacterium]SHM82767.1 cAMP-binding domain of CRP or a regulatory subunit of cAMP-dependent protein kinases [Caldanaerovirga acetigignens]